MIIQRTQVLAPAPTWQLTLSIILLSGKLISSHLYGHCTHVVYIFVQANVYTQEIKTTKSFLKRVLSSAFLTQKHKCDHIQLMSRVHTWKLKQRIIFKSAILPCAFRGYILCSLVCLNMYTCVHGDHRTPSCFFQAFIIFYDRVSCQFGIPPKRRGQLTRNSQGYSWLCLFGARLHSHTTTQLLRLGSGDQSHVFKACNVLTELSPEPPHQSILTVT